MKKVYYCSFAICSFFIFSFGLNAITYDDSKINFYTFNYNYSNPLSDGMDLFNLFEEMKNDTLFYKMLNSYGENISTYLNSLSTFENSGKYEYILIFSKDELSYFYSDPYYSNANYLILRLVSNTPLVAKNSNNSIYFAYNTGSYKFDAYFFKDNQFLFHSNSSFSHLIDDYKFNYSWDINFFHSIYTGSNFSYLISKFYYSNVSISYDSTALMTSLLFQYMIDDSKVLSFDKNYLDLKNLGISYLNDYPLISKNYPFLPYINMINYFKNSKLNLVPDDYVVAEFDLSNSLNLFPISSSCDLNDYGLYSYSSNSSSINLYYHTLDENDKFGYLASYYSTYSYSDKNDLIIINPMSKATDINDSSNIKVFQSSDFIKFYYNFKGKDNKSSYYVYYNPSCYVASEKNADISFVNPSTGNDVSFSGNTTDWKDPDNVGSVNSVSFFDLDSKTVFDNLKTSASSIVEAGVEIVSLSSLLFDSLPYEVKTLLLAGFIIVLMVALLKILTKFL